MVAAHDGPGRTEWRTGTPKQADGKYLVIGQGLHDDVDCSLLCFRASDGKLHWSIETRLHIESSPAIFEDLVNFLSVNPSRPIQSL